MKKSIIILILILTSCLGYSQMNFEPSYSNGYSNISGSVYLSNRYSIGLEARAEWDWFYMGFHTEALNQRAGYNDVELVYNVGASVGAYQKYNNFMFFEGIKLGKISRDGDLKTSYGLECEIDYVFNNGYFIGLKGNLDKYNHGETKETVSTIDYSRIFIKVGFKFF